MRGLSKFLPRTFVWQIGVQFDNQSGGLANAAHVIVNEFSEKLIEQYEKRIVEKDETITLLKEMIHQKDEQIKYMRNSP